jgi:hypothetical protein
MLPFPLWEWNKQQTTHSRPIDNKYRYIIYLCINNYIGKNKTDKEEEFDAVSCSLIIMNEKNILVELYFGMD